MGALSFLAGTGQTRGGLVANDTDPAAHARRGFEEAEARYQKAPTEVAAVWQFGRACFDLAEFATNSTQRASLAEEGSAACRRAIGLDSNSAPAHYYLGLNLGQLARTKGLAALRLVGQMEQEFARARDLDPQWDYAGPDRNLGLLYRDAPVIGSIGSRARAREHLKRATELAPQHPGNRLSLIEAYSKWGDRTEAYRELQTLEAAWPAARTNFVGAPWTATWADWETRLKKLKKKLEEPSKALDSPREKQ